MKKIMIGLALCFPAVVFAWGGKGHAAVAALAEANLTPDVEAQVQRLLVGDLNAQGKPSDRKTLAAVASWPDEIRDEAQKTDPKAYAGWHTRSNQVCSNILGACPDGHCADELIIHYTGVLADRAAAVKDRNEALKWIVHLVGDEHQPLHSGINPNGGGMKVIIAGYTPKAGRELTLHKAWDDELANAALKGWKSSARLEAHLPPLPADAPTQWMKETREVALHEVYEPLPGFSCYFKMGEPVTLDEAYQQHSVAVVRQQIERAGLRLAQLLNQTLGR